jgi:hypothetical protein
MSTLDAAVDSPNERRRRRVLVAGGIAFLVVAAVAAGLWLAFGRDSSASGTSGTTAAASTTLAPVTRRNLAETETFSGTLGYADERPLAAQAQGTITWIAPEGAPRKRGQVLYRLDDAPVVLMYGATPAWRELSSGVSDGPDVAELEWNLVRLGFDPNRDVQIDAHWDWATTAAVERWQGAHGLDETGSVALGSVVFLPRPRRIGQHAAAVGDSVQPGSAVMSTSSISQQVEVDLDATDQTLAVVGRRVSIDLPDGSSVAGRITNVGKVAQAATSSTSTSSAADSSSTSASTGATIEVDISLLRRPDDELDQAPVDVNLTTASRARVLAVPVTALVALLGGGYAVEVAGGGTTHLVAVTPGLYAGGYVEVSGVRAGERVVVPQ